MSTFTKAAKNQLKARIALDGPTGSGKTYSALVFATALVEKSSGRIAVIDTENDRALTYADKFDFDHVSLKAPYSPQRYVDLINAAIVEGYEVVLVDSLSHAWAAEGGVLDIKDKAAERSRSKNTFDAWRHASPEHDKLVNALVNCPIHIIGTMRSKMAYVLEEQERDGRKVQVPRKVGMQPVQREGMEYEFDLILDIDLDHVLVATKSRCDEIADRIVRNPNHDPTETYKVAREFRDWLNSGEPPKRFAWLDELCERFGEGETLDGINALRSQAGQPALTSTVQVADVSPERVQILADFLEQHYGTKTDVETEASGESPSTSADSAEAPSPDSSVAEGGDGVTPDKDNGSGDPSLRNGQSATAQASGQVDGSDSSTSSEDGKPEDEVAAAAERARQAAMKKAKPAQSELGEEDEESLSETAKGAPESSSSQSSEGVRA